MPRSMVRLSENLRRGDGTGVTLAKLGAQVSSAGAIGQDALGDALLSMLAAAGVDTALLVRRAEMQTSASVLPIRPDGSRPAFHVIGANAAYTSADAPWDAIAQAGYLHLGAPEFMGGEEAARILRHARAHGTVTSADLLVPGDQAAHVLDWIGAALSELDYLLPNAEQVRGLTGTTDLEAGCGALRAHGVGCVAVTDGGRGALVVDASGAERVPAFAVDVVDTTGCGDAFSAGFLRGVSLGLGHTEAARLGCATAALVAGGLGSDHGHFGLADVQQLAAVGAAR
ncbi:MAG TPA: PfkB family carbohydrate kinase [Solirubrobacteraceae bacterium]|nr:PfkB family carbohydrate kinase [Solirubrobacteraceae bacterium]